MKEYIEIVIITALGLINNYTIREEVDQILSISPRSDSVKELNEEVMTIEKSLVSIEQKSDFSDIEQV
jgi:hypothetical protein